LRGEGTLSGFAAKGVGSIALSASRLGKSVVQIALDCFDQSCMLGLGSLSASGAIRDDHYFSKIRVVAT